MNFPIITWSDTVGPFTVDGATPVAPYDAAATCYGFGISNTSTKAAASYTAAAYLLGAVNTIYAGAITAATFEYTDGPGPSNSPLVIRWTNTRTTAIVLNFGTVAKANQFGFATSSVTIPAAVTSPFALPGYLVTTINPGMFWGPAGLAGDVRRMLTQRAASSSSNMSGLSTDVVNWGAVADLEMMSTIFCAANYTRWFAAIQIYANAANRLVTDPNNTLEGLIEAASEGKTFYLYREAATTNGTVPGTFQTCRMPGVSSKGSAQDFVTAADEPRLWSTAGLIFRGVT
jgi:hypothetical protein